MDVAEIEIRDAVGDDLDAMVALLPRLADYELPEGRTADMFWASDAKLLASWSKGEQPDVFVKVASAADQVVGVAMVSMGADHFSGQRCGHLEVVVVDPVIDGRGAGRRLIAACESEIVRRDGEIISLHVVGNNERARGVYAQLGFSEEMIRATKFLQH